MKLMASLLKDDRSAQILFIIFKYIQLYHAYFYFQFFISQISYSLSSIDSMLPRV